MTPHSLGPANGRKSTEIQLRMTTERKLWIKQMAKLVKMNQTEFLDDCVNRRAKELAKKFPELVGEGVN